MSAETPNAKPTEGLWGPIVEGMTISRRCLADWNKWSRVPVLTVQQAIDLSLGVTPGSSHNCQPYDPVAVRVGLVEVDIGLGCRIGVIPGSVNNSLSYVDLSRARVRLTHFADWVVANGMKLHPDCPRTTRSAAVEPLGLRREATLYRTIGMLALSVARRKPGKDGQSQPSINAIAEAAIEAAKKANATGLLGRSTLTQHIRQGLREVKEK